MTEVTCAIILDKGNVLITQRSESMPHPLKWEFPGGKVKEGESIEECIVREIREELGVKVEVNRLLPSVKHSYGNFPIMLIPLICTMRKGEISLKEHKSYKWISLDEMERVDWLEADRGVVRLLMEKL